MFSLEVSTKCFSFILIIEFQPLFLSKKPLFFTKSCLKAWYYSKSFIAKVGCCGHGSYEFKRSLLDATLSDKNLSVTWTGWWFSTGTPVSSTNKTDRHNLTEILLKVALNTI